jgi:hypothetical protein
MDADVRQCLLEINSALKAIDERTRILSVSVQSLVRVFSEESPEFRGLYSSAFEDLRIQLSTDEDVRSLDDIRQRLQTLLTTQMGQA